MITISFKTSSLKAIAFARKLMESKRETQEEIRQDFKSPEFQKAIEELKRRNAEEKTNL